MSEQICKRIVSKNALSRQPDEDVGFTTMKDNNSCLQLRVNCQ